MLTDTLLEILNDPVFKKQGLINKKSYNQKVDQLVECYKDISNTELRQLCKERGLNCGPLTTNSMKNIWMKRLGRKILDDFINDEDNSIDQLDEATTTCDSVSEDEDFLERHPQTGAQVEATAEVQPLKTNPNPEPIEQETEQNSEIPESVKNELKQTLISEIKEISQEISQMKKDNDALKEQAKIVEENNTALQEQESNTISASKVMFWSLVFVILAALVQIFFRREGMGNLLD